MRPGSSQTIGRAVQTSRRAREDFAAGLRDADGMLELGRQLPVPGDRRPTIRQYFYVRLAEVDHRFDGEKHPRLQFRPLAGDAIVQNIGPVMKYAPQAVAAKVSDHAAPLRLGVGLDGRPD